MHIAASPLISLDYHMVQPPAAIDRTHLRPDAVMRSLGLQQRLLPKAPYEFPSLPIKYPSFQIGASDFKTHKEHHTLARHIQLVNLSLLDPCVESENVSPPSDPKVANYCVVLTGRASGCSGCGGGPWVD